MTNIILACLLLVSFSFLTISMNAHAKDYRKRLPLLTEDPISRVEPKEKSTVPQEGLSPKLEQGPTAGGN